MKAVLISIQPKWCEAIASGRKTVEVRKTKPKIETPFKCYIYCTTDKRLLCKFDKGERIDDETFFTEHVFVRQNTWIRGHFNPNKKVIGEFVCDKIIKLNYSCGSYRCEGLNRVENDRIASASQLSLYDMRNYLTCKGGYAWHISDLVIYDKPKELSEFLTIKCTNKKSSCSECETKPHCIKPITRPPQSWCYVEELR